MTTDLTLTALTGHCRGPSSPTLSLNKGSTQHLPCVTHGAMTCRFNSGHHRWRASVLVQRRMETLKEVSYKGEIIEGSSQGNKARLGWRRMTQGEAVTSQ